MGAHAHEIMIVTVKPKPLYGHPMLAARCSCGWQAEQRGGRHGAEYAKADGEAHLRSVDEAS